MRECPLLGIDSHSAVIAHMLMAAESHIEQRSLSAVRISHKGHLYYLATLMGQVRHAPLEAQVITLLSLQCLKPMHIRILSGNILVCNFGLGLPYHLYFLSLFPAQRNLVSYYLILDRVLQGRVQYHLDTVPLDESHLYYSFAEAAVAIYFHDHATFSRPKFRQFHKLFPSFTTAKIHITAPTSFKRHNKTAPSHDILRERVPSAPH